MQGAVAAVPGGLSAKGGAEQRSCPVQQDGWISIQADKVMLCRTWAKFLSCRVSSRQPKTVRLIPR